MPVEEMLSDLKRKIKEKLPKGVTLSGLEFEGSKLVIYTDEPRKFVDNEETIRWLAKDLHKRIIVRSDSSVLVDTEKAINEIKEIVPYESGITDCYFDLDTGEVVIEAEKPGLVIGRHGSTLRKITKETGWTPKVVRTPPMGSSIVNSIREYLRSEKEARKALLRDIGCKIHKDVTSKHQWIRLTSLGGCREVGRSSLILSTPETRVLIDCGVNVGSSENGTPYLYIPEASPIDQIDAVVITHAHLDHAGLVPLLFKYGYDGPVYMTPPTRDLMALLQLDYIDVAAKEGKKIPYESSMVREALKHTIMLDYGDVTDIAPDMKVTLYNAGHILGSSIVHFHIGDGLHNVAFTGDFKYERTLLFNPATNDFPRLESLIIEGTYGGIGDYQPSRHEAERNLQDTIRRTIDRGGKVLIPAFAVGRSQEVMVVLEKAIRNGTIGDIPVYLDGMIWEGTAIHTTYPEYLNNNLKDLILHGGLNPFLSKIFINVDSESKREEAIDGGSSIILTTSGMLNGGPVMEYLKTLSSDERNTLVFVGYQAEGTLGRRIQRGWKEIQTPGCRDSIKMEMEIKTIDGFSGHSDRGQLVEYVNNMSPRPKMILTNHGEGSKCTELASYIHKKYKIDTKAPLNLETVRLM
jgi:hypothetical protein